MQKTTLYLPDDLKAGLARMAEEERRSEAAIIREAIGAAVTRRRRPRPRIPLCERGLGSPGAADRADKLLAGFGRR